MSNPTITDYLKYPNLQMAAATRFLETAKGAVFDYFFCKTTSQNMEFL
jgi:hypothetical protein